MKYSVFFVMVILITGCSSSKKPPIKYISKQSHLEIAKYDSVEYYKSDKSIWNFPAQDPFIVILHFDDQHYQQIIKQIKQDTSYYEIHDEQRLQKGYKAYFKRFLTPAPYCSMKNKAYIFNYPRIILDDTIIFCNRIYFRHRLGGPFD